MRVTRWEYCKIVERFEQNHYLNYTLPDRIDAPYNTEAVRSEVEPIIERHPKSIAFVIREMGKNGWEMCGIAVEKRDLYTEQAYWFKRPQEGSVQ